MKFYIITGFTCCDVWTRCMVYTIPECIEKRAREQGIIKITNIIQIETNQ